MAKRAEEALGGIGKEKKQPQKGVKGKRKPHAIHSRKVANGYLTETHYRDGADPAMEEHAHPDIKALLKHLSDNYEEEMEEVKKGGEEIPEGDAGEEMAESGKPVSADADEEMKKKLAGEMMG